MREEHRTAAPVAPPRGAPAQAARGKTLKRLIPVFVLVPVLTVSAIAIGSSLSISSQGAQTTASAPDAPQSPAGAWLMQNTFRDERVFVDAAMASALTAEGWDRGNLVAYDDGANTDDEPFGWRSADYVVVTDEMRALAGDHEQLMQAMQNSVVAASFGTGDDAVEIRRIAPEGAVLVSAEEARAAAVRTEYGTQLAANSAVTMSDSDRALLTQGRVDPRIIVVLATLAADAPVSVGAFPIVDGEQDGPIRQVAIAGVGGRRLVAQGEATSEAQDLIRSFSGQFAPRQITAAGAVLVLEYPLAEGPLDE